MGNVQPYRVSAREPRTRDVVPRIVAIGLSVAAWGFALGAVTWVLARAVMLFAETPRAPQYVELIYAWTIDAAILSAAALCAWRPLPGTRSHVFARLAVVGWLVGVVAEQWPRHVVMRYDPCGRVVGHAMDPPGVLVAASIGRLLLFLSLAGIALASGRRFALPRWTPVVAAGLGASLTEVNLDQVLGGGRAGPDPIRFPLYALSITELLMLVAFSAAFAAAARAARRRPFLDEEVALWTPSASTSEPRAYAYWRASIGAVLACLFALTSFAGEGLACIPSLGGWVSIRPIALGLALVAFPVFVERARRRHAEASSFSLTLGAGAAALCGAAAAFRISVDGLVVFRVLGVVTTAFTLAGIALLLPNLPARADVVAKVKGALYAGAALLVFAVGAELGIAASSTSALTTTRSWIRADTLVLLAAVVFVTIAVHLARPIEREALLAEARARRASE
ncbi:MAG: hypothetical protein KF782_07380 [Labilithrix sp.]|nr:hypothetical protein [Labilithrix sp.]